MGKETTQGDRSEGEQRDKINREAKATETKAHVLNDGSTTNHGIGQSVGVWLGVGTAILEGGFAPHVRTPSYGPRLF